jgi:transcriptional regulator with XRE-family HTH domain
MDIILRLRNRAGLTQVKLAALVGLDASYVSQLEAGLRRPSVTVLHDLLKVLGASPDERSEALAQAAGDDPAAPAVAA